MSSLGGYRLVNRPRPMLEAAAPAAVLSAKAGKARHPQRRTCDEAGQGAAVGDSFRGTPHRERAARVCDGMTGFLRTLVLTIGLLCHGQSGATGLLSELDVILTLDLEQWASAGERRSEA